MTKDKRLINKSRWAVSILAALMFGAFLGSPVPEDWTGRLVHYISSDRPAYSDNPAYKAVTSEPAIQAATTGSAVNAAVSGPAGNVQASGSAVEVLVPQPAIDTIVSVTPAEARPEYVSVNGNRGGAADRKEKDVLIRLINAEAYGYPIKPSLP
jgi:hypothetical protein